MLVSVPCTRHIDAEQRKTSRPCVPIPVPQAHCTGRMQQAGAEHGGRRDTPRTQDSRQQYEGDYGKGGNRREQGAPGRKVSETPRAETEATALTMARDHLPARRRSLPAPPVSSRTWYPRTTQWGRRTSLAPVRDHHATAGWLQYSGKDSATEMVPIATRTVGSHLPWWR